MGVPEKLSTAEALAAGTLAIVLSIGGNIVGSVVYPIAVEIPSTRLRVISFALARGVHEVANVAFVNIVLPRQTNPEEWNWGLKSGLFWAGINLIFVIYIYFRLRKYFLTNTLYPIASQRNGLFAAAETKGRTPAEMNILFENKVSARKFASTNVALLTLGIENTGDELDTRLANTAALQYRTRDIVVMHFGK